MEEKNLCPKCGSLVNTTKFCPQCGASLADENGVITKVKVPQPKTEEGPSDYGLKIIVDCIKSTIATIGGDGYTETVLYFDEDNNQYSIHTYRKYQPDNILHHHAYRSDEVFKNKVLEYIEKSKIINYKDKCGIGLCGGRYACKFLYENELVRISTDNMDSSGPSVLSSIHSFLNSGILKENELLK